MIGYQVPTFNLRCNIWTGPGPNQTPVIPPPGSPRVANVPCQLTYGRRVNTMSTGGTGGAGVLVQTMNLQLPKLTDIRGIQDTIAVDIVECPAGSGRWYLVGFVDDIGKGFNNEHRTAGIFAIPQTWVAPYP